MKVQAIAVKCLAHPVWPRPFIAISDIHENSAGGQDNCQRDLLYEWLLGYASEEFDLFILGDWHDFWESPGGGPVYQHNEKLERNIARFHVVFLPGNHDDAPGCFYTSIDRDGLFAWHGHQLDPACRGRGTLGMIASKIWGGIERIGLGRPLAGVKRAIVRQANRRIKTASIRGDGNIAYIADATDRARRDGVMLYIHGHTHWAQLLQLKTGDCIYANTGSWTEPGKGWAIIVQGTEVKLVEVTK